MRVAELRDDLQEYVCRCISDCHRHMETGDYGRQWGSIKHLHNVLTAWALLDSEVTRLAEEE
jgi:hypothetical protein